MGQILVSKIIPSDRNPRFLAADGIRRIVESRIQHTVSHSRNDRCFDEANATNDEMIQKVVRSVLPFSATPAMVHTPMFAPVDDTH